MHIKHDDFSNVLPFEFTDNTKLFKINVYLNIVLTLLIFADLVTYSDAYTYVRTYVYQTKV